MLKGRQPKTAMRGKSVRPGRSGMTLTELLVAMSILLVGIYAVARGFPALFGNLESERIRTEMVRRVEARVGQLKNRPYRIPDAITGHDPIDASVIPPALYPDETMDPIPGNPRDDLIEVRSESFVVPTVQEGETVSVYPLNLGLATVQDLSAVGNSLQVYRVDALQPGYRDQADWEQHGPALGDDQFFLDEDGFLYAPSQYPQARVDYVWVDANGHRHGVQGEVVENVNSNPAAAPVRATLITAPAFQNVMPAQSEAEGRVPYTPVVGGAADVAPFTAVLESTFGAALLLPGADSGQSMEVNYQLKTEPDTNDNPRRVPVMMEQTAAPTQPPYQIDLAFRGIDEQTPLFSQDLLGNAFDPPVYVLVVDLLSGQAFTDADAWVHLDFVEGRLRLDWEDAAAPLTPAQARGRSLRIFYRTINAHTIVVQKTPEAFVEETVANTYTNQRDVDYRYYRIEPDPDAAAYTRLLFPQSVADQMVVVDYMAVDYVRGDGTEMLKNVTGELHTIPGNTLAITLNEPEVRGVLSVQGVSMIVQGWWRGDGGRVQMVDIATFLKPEPLM